MREMHELISTKKKKMLNQFIHSFEVLVFGHSAMRSTICFPFVSMFRTHSIHFYIEIFNANESSFMSLFLRHIQISINRNGISCKRVINRFQGTLKWAKNLINNHRNVLELQCNRRKKKKWKSLEFRLFLTLLGQLNDDNIEFLMSSKQFD